MCKGICYNTNLATAFMTTDLFTQSSNLSTSCLLPAVSLDQILLQGINSPNYLCLSEPVPPPRLPRMLSKSLGKLELGDGRQHCFGSHCKVLEAMIRIRHCGQDL